MKKGNKNSSSKHSSSKKPSYLSCKSLPISTYDVSLKDKKRQKNMSCNIDGKSKKRRPKYSDEENTDQKEFLSREKIFCDLCGNYQNSRKTDRKTNRVKKKYKKSNRFKSNSDNWSTRSEIEKQNRIGRKVNRIIDNSSECFTEMTISEDSYPEEQNLNCFYDVNNNIKKYSSERSMDILNMKLNLKNQRYINENSGNESSYHEDIATLQSNNGSSDQNLRVKELYMIDNIEEYEKELKMRRQKQKKLKKKNQERVNSAEILKNKKPHSKRFFKLPSLHKSNVGNIQSFKKNNKEDETTFEPNIICIKKSTVESLKIINKKTITSKSQLINRSHVEEVLGNKTNECYVVGNYLERGDFQCGKSQRNSIGVNKTYSRMIVSPRENLSKEFQSIGKDDFKEICDIFPEGIREESLKLLKFLSDVNRSNLCQKYSTSFQGIKIKSYESVISYNRLDKSDFKFKNDVLNSDEDNNLDDTVSLKLIKCLKKPKENSLQNVKQTVTKGDKTRIQNNISNKLKFIGLAQSKKEFGLFLINKTKPTPPMRKKAMNDTSSNKCKRTWNRSMKPNCFTDITQGFSASSYLRNTENYLLNNLFRETDRYLWTGTYGQKKITEFPPKTIRSNFSFENSNTQRIHTNFRKNNTRKKHFGKNFGPSNFSCRSRKGRSSSKLSSDSVQFLRHRMQRNRLLSKSKNLIRPKKTIATTFVESPRINSNTEEIPSCDNSINKKKLITNFLNIQFSGDFNISISDDKIEVYNLKNGKRPLSIILEKVKSSKSVEFLNKSELISQKQEINQKNAYNLWNLPGKRTEFTNNGNIADQEKLHEIIQQKSKDTASITCTNTELDLNFTSKSDKNSSFNNHKNYEKSEKILQECKNDEKTIERPVECIELLMNNCIEDSSNMILPVQEKATFRESQWNNKGNELKENHLSKEKESNEMKDESNSKANNDSFADNSETINCDKKSSNEQSIKEENENSGISSELNPSISIKDIEFNNVSISNVPNTEVKYENEDKNNHIESISTTENSSLKYKHESLFSKIKRIILKKRKKAKEEKGTIKIQNRMRSDSKIAVPLKCLKIIELENQKNCLFREEVKSLNNLRNFNAVNQSSDETKTRVAVCPFARPLFLQPINLNENQSSSLDFNRHDRSTCVNNQSVNIEKLRSFNHFDSCHNLPYCHINFVDYGCTNYCSHNNIKKHSDKINVNNKTKYFNNLHNINQTLNKIDQSNLNKMESNESSTSFDEEEYDIKQKKKINSDSKCKKELQNCKTSVLKIEGLKFKNIKRRKNIMQRIFGKLKHKKRHLDDKVSSYKYVKPQELIDQIPAVSENQRKIIRWLKKVASDHPHDLRKVQDKLIKQLSKIMSSEAEMPLKDVLDIIHPPQVRKDQMSYSGRKMFRQVNNKNFLVDDESQSIMLTEEMNVRGFLVSIGFKDDVAWEAQENPVLTARINAALTEARCWVNKILKSEGLLIYILSVMMPDKIVQFYLQIVEAIVNKRINNVQMLLNTVLVLKRYEGGKYSIKSIFSRSHIDLLLPKQVTEIEAILNNKRERFKYLHCLAEKSAKLAQLLLTKQANGLLARLTQSYSPGLEPYLKILVDYIAQGIIVDKNQLLMSIAYLQNLKVDNFNPTEFEKRAGIEEGKVIFLDDSNIRSSVTNKEPTTGGDKTVGNRGTPRSDELRPKIRNTMEKSSYCGMKCSCHYEKKDSINYVKRDRSHHEKRDKSNHNEKVGSSHEKKNNCHHEKNDRSYHEKKDSCNHEKNDSYNHEKKDRPHHEKRDNSNHKKQISSKHEKKDITLHKKKDGCNQEKTVNSNHEKKDVSNYEKKDGSNYEKKDGSNYEKKDGSNYEKNDVSIREKKDGSNHEKKDGSIYEKKDVSIREKKDGSNYEKKDVSIREKKDGSNFEKKDVSIREKKDGSNYEKKDVSIREKKDVSIREKKDGSNHEKKDVSIREKKDGSNHEKKDVCIHENKDVSIHEKKDGSNQEKKVNPNHEKKLNSIHEKKDGSNQEKKVNSNHEKKDASIHENKDGSNHKKKDGSNHEKIVNSNHEKKLNSIHEKKDGSNQEKKVASNHEKKDISNYDTIKPTSIQKEDKSKPKQILNSPSLEQLTSQNKDNNRQVTTWYNIPFDKLCHRKDSSHPDKRGNSPTRYSQRQCKHLNKHELTNQPKKEYKSVFGRTRHNFDEHLNDNKTDDAVSKMKKKPTN